MHEIRKRRKEKEIIKRKRKLDENFVGQEKCITFAATCLPRFP